MSTSEQALVARYTRRHNRIRLASATAVARAWDTLAGLDDRSATRFAGTAAILSTAAQNQTAASVDAYLALLLDADPVGIDVANVTGAAVRNGADPHDVYHRSIVTARAKIADGLSFDDAMRAGRARAIDAVETDVALTQRAAIATDNRVVGYRRVLTGKSCALCATASTQRYRSGQLMPIHGHCDCGVAPIMGNSDPGHVINKPLLRDLKKAGKQTGDPDYWQSRHISVDADGTVRLPEVAVREHGELGPVLTDASHDFTSLGAA